MKYLKLFESYLSDKYESLKKEIKEEIDTYMFSITDEYQITNEYDYINFFPDSIYISYDKIVINKNNFDVLSPAITKTRKVLEKVFDAEVAFAYLNEDNKYYDLSRDHLISSMDKGEELTIKIMIRLKK